MTSRLPRARMIQGAPGRTVLYVVYDKGVGLDEVRPLVRQMSAQRGVQARAQEGALDNPRGPKVAIVELTIQGTANRAAVMRLLKRLANPQLPVAIRLIRVMVLICRCNYISTALDALEFYPGLGPDDMDAFRRGYVAQMTQLPVARLFGEEPQPPYKLLTDGLEAVLAGLGARATMVEVAPRRDHRPCAHPQ